VKATFTTNSGAFAFMFHKGGIMILKFSKHAEVRAQQRGVPYQIADLLIQYGAEQHDGHGGVIRYFSSESIREMQSEIGQTTVKKISEHLRTYLVEACSDGAVITVGKLYTNKHIWRH